MSNRTLQKEEDFHKMFCGGMPAKIMILLNEDKESYTTKIASLTPCTFSHAVNVLEKLKKMGFAEFSLNGRKKHITLTPKGAELAKRLQNVANFKL